VFVSRCPSVPLALTEEDISNEIRPDISIGVQQFSVASKSKAGFFTANY
jgi:hypothetical protein